MSSSPYEQHKELMSIIICHFSSYACEYDIVNIQKWLNVNLNLIITCLLYNYQLNFFLQSPDNHQDLSMAHQSEKVCQAAALSYFSFEIQQKDFLILCQTFFNDTACNISLETLEKSMGLTLSNFVVGNNSNIFKDVTNASLLSDNFWNKCSEINHLEIWTWKILVFAALTI